MPKSTVYKILMRVAQTGSVACKRGSGRKAIKCIAKKEKLSRVHLTTKMLSHKSQRELAIQFGCEQGTTYFLTQGGAYAGEGGFTNQGGGAYLFFLSGP